jgi:GT2 family glycosyltransferase
MPLPSSPGFSVIICSIDALKFAQVSMNYERLLAGYPHEIIGIHDAASLTEGYNRGMERATGDILVFSHDDVLILDAGFAVKIAARLQHYDLLGFCGTDLLLAPGWICAGAPHIFGALAHVHESALTLDVFGIADWPVAGNIQAMDGLCLMATREAALSVGFDADCFDGFHHYDLDFSFSAYLAGRRLGVCCDIPVIHASCGDFDSPQFAHYAQRFRQKYARHLPNAPLRTADKGKGALFQDHQAILGAWTEDILRRAVYRSVRLPARI